jgi:hypothetical protein
MALYRLFKPVGETQAKLVVILGALVSVPIAFLNVLNEVAALALVSGASYLSAFGKPELDALAYLFMHPLCSRVCRNHLEGPCAESSRSSRGQSPSTRTRSRARLARSITAVPTAGVNGSPTISGSGSAMLA